MDQSCSSEPIKCVLLMEVESEALKNRAALDRKLYGVLPGPKICTLAVSSFQESHNWVDLATRERLSSRCHSRDRDPVSQPGISF